jgi:hypothetical protein
MRPSSASKSGKGGGSNRVRHDNRRGVLYRVAAAWERCFGPLG